MVFFLPYFCRMFSQGCIWLESLLIRIGSWCFGMASRFLDMFEVAACFRIVIYCGFCQFWFCFSIWLINVVCFKVNVVMNVECVWLHLIVVDCLHFFWSIGYVIVVMLSRIWLFENVICRVGFGDNMEDGWRYCWNRLMTYIYIYILYLFVG